MRKIKIFFFVSFNLVNLLKEKFSTKGELQYSRKFSITFFKLV